MRLVYIAGPYRAPTPWGIRCNIRNAEDLAAKVNEAGMAAVCPHSWGSGGNVTAGLDAVAIAARDELCAAALAV